MKRQLSFCLGLAALVSFSSMASEPFHEGKRECFFRDLSDQAREAAVNALSRGEIFSMTLKRLAHDAPVSEQVCSLGKCERGTLRESLGFVYSVFPESRLAALNDAMREQVHFETYGTVYLTVDGRAANIGFERRNKVDAASVLGRKDVPRSMSSGLLIESIDGRITPFWADNGLTEFEYTLKFKYELMSPLQLKMSNDGLRLFNGRAQMDKDSAFVFVSQGRDNDGLLEPTYWLTLQRLKPNENGSPCTQ